MQISLVIREIGYKAKNYLLANCLLYPRFTVLLVSVTPSILCDKSSNPVLLTMCSLMALANHRRVVMEFDQSKDVCDRRWPIRGEMMWKLTNRWGCLIRYTVGRTTKLVTYWWATRRHFGAKIFLSPDFHRSSNHQSMMRSVSRLDYTHELFANEPITSLVFRQHRTNQIVRYSIPTVEQRVIEPIKSFVTS